MLRKVLPAGLLLPALLAPGVAAAGPTPTATERTCHGLTATIVGTAGDDRITGTRGPDVVVGLGGNDRIDGRGGDDVICGNGGADDLVGGRGSDQLYGGRDLHERHGRYTRVHGDLLAGGPGDDHLDVGFQKLPGGRIAIWRRNAVTFRDSAQPVTVDLSTGTVAGEGADTVRSGRNLEVRGSRHDDVVIGSRRPETLDAGRGDDRVSGGGGRDAVLGYRGDDVLDGGPGRDFVISTRGVSTVAGGDGDDVLLAGSPAPTTVLGGAGFDYIERRITAGETGVIDGGDDDNYLELETSSLWWDRSPGFEVDAAAGTFTATAGEDVQETTFTGISGFILWGPGRWTFLGSDADDAVQVLDGRLDAQGFGGDDFLLGAERADVLDGGEGTDAGWGGEGRNTCLDTETGDCDGYPWDQRAARSPDGARLAAGWHRGLGHEALVRRWLAQSSRTWRR